MYAVFLDMFYEFPKSLVAEVMNVSSLIFPWGGALAGSGASLASSGIG